MFRNIFDIEELKKEIAVQLPHIKDKKHLQRVAASIKILELTKHHDVQNYNPFLFAHVPLNANVVQQPELPEPDKNTFLPSN